jgi:hypothetical protein
VWCFNINRKEKEKRMKKFIMLLMIMMFVGVGCGKAPESTGAGGAEVVSSGTQVVPMTAPGDGSGVTPTTSETTTPTTN